jgi:hypothetical protein
LKGSEEGRLCKRAQEREEADRRKNRDRQNDGHELQSDRGSSLAASPLTRPIISRLIARQRFPPADVKNKQIGPAKAMKKRNLLVKKGPLREEVQRAGL